MTDERLIRLANLKRLCAARDWGPTYLSKRLGGNASYWSAMLRGDKTKSFGEKAARKVESGLHLPRGWLDQEQAELSAAPLISGVAAQVGECLTKVVGDLSALPQEDADAFGAELLQLCGRLHERAEQLRAGNHHQRLPRDLADIKRELDEMTEEERAAAHARIMNAIAGLMPSQARPPEPAPSRPAPAAQPKRGRQPHR